MRPPLLALAAALLGCVPGPALPPAAPDGSASADTGERDAGSGGGDAEATPDGGPDASDDLGRPDAGPPDGAPDAGRLEADAASPDVGAVALDGGAPGPSFVEVGHERELRAAWIATVSNINFPSRQGLSAAAQIAELTGLLDTARGAGLNAVVFQVRPECDALYRSSLEPWSRYLTGQQGGDPGYDPLEVLVAEAHARGLEVHAWFNPYRAKSSFSAQVAPNHLSVRLAEHTVRYGNYAWLDPGAEAVRAAVDEVIADVVTRYDVDGVHFDDYFYPYPDGTEFPDDGTYADYTAGGGALSRDDWRRENVHLMVERVSRTIASRRPDVRFGISPFGIYRPGQPPGITGLDQYDAIYSDPLRWMAEGWVDYLAPQLYWPSTQTRQAYGPLVSWWADQTQDGRYIFPGNYLSKLGDSGWTLDEFRTQIALTRAERAGGAQGNIFFTIAPLEDDELGIVGLFRDELYRIPALTPRLATADEGTVVAPPLVSVAGARVSVSPGSPERLRAFVAYALLPSGPEVRALLPLAAPEVELSPGRYAISAVDRSGLESLGVIVELP